MDTRINGDSGDVPERSYWPFPLERIPDAVEICLDRRIVIEQYGLPVHGDAACCVCGAQATVAFSVYDSEVCLERWIYDKSRRDEGRCLNYRARAALYGEHRPFCSATCYASYVLWSLYVPVTGQQKLATVYILPAWVIRRISNPPRP